MSYSVFVRLAVAMIVAVTAIIIVAFAVCVSVVVVIAVALADYSRTMLTAEGQAWRYFCGKNKVLRLH